MNDQHGVPPSKPHDPTLKGQPPHQDPPPPILAGSVPDDPHTVLTRVRDLVAALEGLRMEGRLGAVPEVEEQLQLILDLVDGLLAGQQLTSGHRW